MSKTIRAMHKNGVLRPLEELKLEEDVEVLITVEEFSREQKTGRDAGDPLASVRFSSGLGDLSQNFDDYRFGRTP